VPIMKKKYFFDHVPKTAGMSVHAAFKSILGSQNVTPVIMMHHRQACLDYKSYRMISGHVFFHPRETFSPDRYYMTLLRDPIDRALSHFYYMQSNLHREGAGLAKWTNIRDYVFSNDESALAVISNYQTGHYVPMEWDGESNLSEMEQLELAKKALDRYDLVGSRDYMEDFLNVFCYECALPPVMEIPRENVTPSRQGSSQVDQDVIERLRELNSADIELYRYATDCLLARKHKMMVKCIMERSGCVGDISACEPMPDERERTDSSKAASEDIGRPDRKETSAFEGPEDFGTREFEILGVYVWGEISKSDCLLSAEKAIIRVAFRANQLTESLTVGIAINDMANRLVYGTNTAALMQKIMISSCGEFFVEFVFRNNLGPGGYAITASIHKGSPDRIVCCHFREYVANFEVSGNLAFAFAGATLLHPNICFGAVKGGTEGIRSVPSVVGFPSAVRYFLDPPTLQQFGAAMRVVSVLGRLRPCELIGIELEITNTTAQTWWSTGLRPVCLSYYWRDDKGDALDLNGLRTDLPRDIGPNETFRMLATVRTPDHKGKALLQFTLVQEFVAWFDEQGVPPAELWVEIGDAP
jgi:hypothetical protein